MIQILRQTPDFETQKLLAQRRSLIDERNQKLIDKDRENETPCI